MLLKWICQVCNARDGHFHGQKAGDDHPCYRSACDGKMVLCEVKEVVMGRDRRSWDEPKAIDSLPPGHPDRMVRSPYEAAKVMERHGLYTHPSDESGTPVAVDYTPMDAPTDRAPSFDLPADMGKRLGKRPVKGHKNLEQVKKNLGMD